MLRRLACASMATNVATSYLVVMTGSFLAQDHTRGPKSSRCPSFRLSVEKQVGWRPKTAAPRSLCVALGGGCQVSLTVPGPNWEENTTGTPAVQWFETRLGSETDGLVERSRCAAA